MSEPEALSDEQLAMVRDFVAWDLLTWAEEHTPTPNPWWCFLPEQDT